VLAHHGHLDPRALEKEIIRNRELAKAGIKE
jgi:hypothetical protein